MKEIPLQELLKLRDKLGSKVYNEAVFTKSSSSKRPINTKPIQKVKKPKIDSEDESPMEVSSKKPLPLWGMKNEKKRRLETRDPRFDDRSGKYTEEKFRNNYEFAFDMRKEELKTLKNELRDPEVESDRKDQIKFLIQRLENQNRSYEQKRTKEEKLVKQKSDIKKAWKDGKMPHFKSKRAEKTEDLVRQYEELKKSGKLAKHIEKRKKKNASKNRKKFNV